MERRKKNLSGIEVSNIGKKDDKHNVSDTGRPPFSSAPEFPQLPGQTKKGNGIV